MQEPSHQSIELWVSSHCRNESFSAFINSVKAVVPKVSGEAEMGYWGAIGDPVSNYISVVLLILSDEMS